MAAPNYAAYDSAQTLSLSAAAHLWVEMTPVAKRGNIAHPSPTDDGWEYEFWLWLKERINQLKSPGYYPKGFHKFPRSLYLEIAKSDEYAALLNTFPKLKAPPLFLFPGERPPPENRSSALGRDHAAEAFEKLRRGPKKKTTPEYIAWAENEFRINNLHARNAYREAAKNVKNKEWSKPGPRTKNNR